MSVDYQLVGQRIRELRQHHQITQETMAEYLNISVAYMSRIECGRTHLNLPMLNRISDYLDTSEAYLLNGLVMECHSPLQQEICRLAASCPPGRQLLLLEVLRAFSRPE